MFSRKFEFLQLSRKKVSLLFHLSRDIRKIISEKKKNEFTSCYYVFILK